MQPIYIVSKAVAVMFKDTYIMSIHTILQTLIIDGLITEYDSHLFDIAIISAMHGHTTCIKCSITT